METFAPDLERFPGADRKPVLSNETAMDFDQFYRRELPAMIALARSICGDHQLAEDVAQEAMTKAHRHWSKVQGYERPGAWLRRVTINLTLSRRRRLIHEISVLTKVGREPDTPEAMADPDAEVWGAVRKLPPKQRAAIALFYQEDQSTSYIAEVLGCSVSTATSHLNLGRKRLALLLGETELEDLT